MLGKIAHEFSVGAAGSFACGLIISRVLASTSLQKAKQLHILRDAEAAYASAGRNGPKREYYHALYRRLLKVFHDGKRIAGDTAGSGGADVGTCLDLERRVLEIATAYADHGFRATLTNAAPNLFTFLRYPGMPPTNNGTERDIRDAVVLQRKFQHKFVNPEGMHVF